MNKSPIKLYALSTAAALLLTMPAMSALAETKPADKPTPKPVANTPAAKPATPAAAPANKPVATAAATTPPVAEFDAVKTHTLDNYQVKLPAVFPVPEHEMRDLKNDKGDLLGQLSLHKALYKNVAFLSSMSPAAQMTDTSVADSRLQRAKTTFLSRKVNPQELTTRTLTIQGHPALEFQVKAGLSAEKPDTIVYTRAMDVLIAPDKFYQFVFLSNKQSDLTAPWVNRYFDSISFKK